MKNISQKYNIKFSIPISLLATLFLLFTFHPAYAQTLRIYHIDVEQADATLIISPSGNTPLIDSGKNGHGSRIKAVMQQAGVSKIDYFVNTHYHEDHYGGIDDLANDSEITVGEVYDRGDKNFIPASKRNGKTYKDYKSAVGNRAEQLRRGETIPLDSAMSVTCIAHGGVVLHELDPPETGDDENTMSVALFIQYGDFRYFIGGDIEQATENKIAERDLVMDVDVYQADHHGSDTSSAIEFMEDLKPAVIIISNGNNGMYKHPRQVTLDHYNLLDPKPMVVQTNKYLKGGAGGNVADEFIADLETVDEDGTILVSVDETTGTCTVSYRDLSHTYTIKNRGHQPSDVVIESLLPNPDGTDRINEEVTSGEYLVDFDMTPSSQTMESPSNPGWFSPSKGFFFGKRDNLGGTA